VAAAGAGQDAAAVAAAATRRAAGLRSFFALDTPVHLRAGGRLAASAALPDSALTARPLLYIREPDRRAGEGQDAVSGHPAA
jgi:fatty acid-binding protein DegV